MRTRIAIALSALALALLPAAAAEAAPPKPPSCSAVLKDGVVTVSWTAPSVAASGRPITAYKVREHGFSKPVLTTKPSVLTVDWTRALRDVASPEMQVRARDASGASKPCIAPVTSAEPDPEPEPEPTPDPEPTPEPETDLLPYGADSFFQSRVDGPGVPINAARTASFRNFMATYSEQAATTWPKVNLNPSWSGHNYVHRNEPAPVWKLASNSGGTADNRLDILRTQGVHLGDDVWDTVPTGTQDRLLVVQDFEFGYTAQCADVAPNLQAHTWTASNCGIMWHSSNGLDYRNPRSNDERNFTSRGRLIDAMQVPRSELDRAIANDTGLGRVMHIFFVRTHNPDGVFHPMVNAESETGGWGAEGERLRIAPSVDLEARGLTGAALAIARTLQQNGAYIGDNSGSTTQLKVGPPEDYVGTNLSTDVFKNKLFWNDFEVVEGGWQ